MKIINLAKAVEVSDELYTLLIVKNFKQFNFAEQFRSVSLSISYNIAGGLGSNSKPDFCKFLNYSYRSIFEVVNMLIVFNKRNYISPELLEKKKSELDHLS